VKPVPSENSVHPHWHSLLSILRRCLADLPRKFSRRKGLVCPIGWSGWYVSLGLGEALGTDVGQTTVAEYMTRRREPPSQGWKTFLRNHADGIAARDLCVVPTMSSRLLFGVLILRYDRREIVWAAVTGHPKAEWVARQLTEAFGWDTAPQYLLRDRDRVYGNVFVQRARAMGIRDRPISARSHGRMDIAKGRSARFGF
jgi:hypothetical protein